MATLLDWLCHFMKIDSKKITKQEKCILEAELYTRVYQEIWEAYKAQYKDYFYLIRANLIKEDIIMELYVIRCLINDLIKSKAYTLPGIAHYTQIPEEIIVDIFMDHKVSSIITFPRRLVDLHKFEQPDTYQNILRKLIPDKLEEEISN